MLVLGRCISSQRLVFGGGHPFLGSWVGSPPERPWPLRSDVWLSFYIRMGTLSVCGGAHLLVGDACDWRVVGSPFQSSYILPCEVDFEGAAPAL